MKTKAATTLKFHPLADAFPLMEGEAFEELTQDIGKHGQIHPVILFEGMVLDGRNRYRACQALGIKPQTREFTGDDPASFVWSENAVRRQLTPGQRAMAAAKIATATVGGYREDRSDRTVRSNENDQGLTLIDASRMTGIGTTSLKRAKAVLRDAVPAVVKAVESGSLPLAPAERVAALPPDEQEALMASTPAVDIPAAVPDPRYHADGKKNRPKPVKTTTSVDDASSELLNHRRWNQKKILTDMGYRWSFMADTLRAIVVEGIDPTLDAEDRIRWSNAMRETASALIAVAKKLKEIDV